jgi:hypothetical protein
MAAEPRERGSSGGEDPHPHRLGVVPVRDIQVLCPMNRGGVGARSLNIELQVALSPAGERKIENDYDEGGRAPCQSGLELDHPHPGSTWGEPMVDFARGGWPRIVERWKPSGASW